MSKSTYQKRRQARYSPYVKGVISVDGVSEGIRPLTEEEAAILEKFNREFVDNNFSDEGPCLHQPLIDKHKDEINDLNEELSVINAYLNNDSKGWRKMNSQDRKNLRSLKRQYLKRKAVIKDRLLEIDPRVGIDSDNYRRSNDPMNYTSRCSNFLDLVKRRDTNNMSEEDVLEVIGSLELD